MKNAIKTILAFIAGVIAILFYSKRANVHDNGTRADAVRNELTESAKRSEAITSGVSDVKSDTIEAGKRADAANEFIDGAKSELDASLDLISRIRKRRH